MTNGKKIKAMFPSMKVGFITDSQIGIYFVKNQHNAVVFSLDWWNAEYKEPVTRDNEIQGELEPTTANGISNKSIIYKAKESKDIQEDLKKT